MRLVENASHKERRQIEKFNELCSWDGGCYPGSLGGVALRENSLDSHEYLIVKIHGTAPKR